MASTEEILSFLRERDTPVSYAHIENYLKKNNLDTNSIRTSLRSLISDGYVGVTTSIHDTEFYSAIDLDDL